MGTRAIRKAGKGVSLTLKRDKRAIRALSRLGGRELLGTKRSRLRYVDARTTIFGGHAHGSRYFALASWNPTPDRHSARILDALRVRS